MTTSGIRGEPLLNLVSYGRHGPGRVDRLSPAQVEQIARTVRRVPEVMVKVSGGGMSPKAVAAHLQYIDRHGKLELELDNGELLKGKGSEEDLADVWDLEADAAEAGSPYGGKPGRKAAKLVHNIVLSMPAGIPPDRLLAASRTFAREQFALKHRYAMVLHTDQDHPHVHLVVKAISEQGERLNVRKATLRGWRREFARHLRDQGVEANATERAVRGECRTRKRDGIYRATLRGASTHTRLRVEAVANELKNGDRGIEAGKAKLLQTRGDIERGWRRVARRLEAEGHQALAIQVNSFIGQMPPPRTERDMIAHALIERVRDREAKERPEVTR
ncbi:MAG: relaxase/mobilization nuclease domain-containing protein [Steroidobacteraceae bacterium]